MKPVDNLVKKTMYFDPNDLQEAKTVFEKRETESEFIRTAIKNEIEKRKKEVDAKC